MLWTVLLLLPLAQSHQVLQEHCEDLSCESRENLLHTIRQLQEQHRETVYGIPKKHSSALSAKKVLNADVGTTASTGTCNACYNRPCLNGGTCIPDAKDPFGPYTCLCPDQFAGPHCGYPVTCTNSSCGPNANCFVSNHQTNCVCKPGYSGNPRSEEGCQVKVKKTCMDGDPHYTTFDGLLYDYMGTCPYIFSEPCGNLTAPYVFYSVKAKNELNGPTSHVSTVRETEVNMYDQIIHIQGSTSQVYVNGLLVNVPWFYPNSQNALVSITFSSGIFYVRNDQQVTVIFNVNGKLCVQVPDVPEFGGQGTLCGLGGNIDGNYKDDIINRNGSIFPVGNNTRMPGSDTDQSAYNAALDSWIIQDFLRLPGNTIDKCLPGRILGNLTKCANTDAAAAACAPILEAEDGRGPFAACMLMGNETIQNMYENCVYDVCMQPSLKCDTLTRFARQCMSTLPNTDLGSWRDDVNCIMNCPINSVYDSCKSSCPATCANATAPVFCDMPCSEGCECLPGYVIDNTNLAKVTCIPVGECGCLDPDGNMHPPNQPWLTDDCQILAQCVNGTYTVKPNRCSVYGECANVNHQMACTCLPGFTGDGYNCTDINECLDPATCSAGKGQGTCNNTLGSYWCTCNEFYRGHDCQYYLPRRHCADIYTYWNERTTGVNWIQPPYPFNGNPPDVTNVTVYCDMDTDNGGWTMMSSDDGDLMSNKTLADYIAGFGSPKDQRVWLGLDIIHGMTTSDKTSMRVNLIRCPRNGLPQTSTFCTYPVFYVNDRPSNYTVFIPQECKGSEQEYYDGWARWDLSKQGPQFVTYDMENASKTCNHCSHTFRNTGFWFDTTYRCGSANLNGVRYKCSDVMDTSDEATYLYWSGSPLGQASLYLRPALYPNYDPHPVNHPNMIL